ncbi:MAG: response regulator [Candidatus Woesearchaeota archaeon]
MSKILVVDDDRNIREKMSGYLGGLGYAVNTAEDGKFAVNCLIRDPFDLVITDRQMPRLRGEELAKLMRGGYRSERDENILNYFSGNADTFDAFTARYKETPIIVMSSEPPSDLARMNLEDIGVTNFLGKGLDLDHPFREDELRVMVARYLPL